MPEFNWEAKFLESVGMEKEGTVLTKEFVGEKLPRLLMPYFPNKRVVNITRDASTEFVAEVIRINRSRNLSVSTHTLLAQHLNGMGRGNTKVYGYELYTNPLSISEMERLMFPMIYGLIGMGDSVSERAAVHFHVGFGQNLRLMKRLLKLCLAIDPILFRLGGMGGVFRGYSNQAAYARPLLTPVAVGISRDSSSIPSNRTPTFLTPTDEEFPSEEDEIQDFLNEEVDEEEPQSLDEIREIISERRRQRSVNAARRRIREVETDAREFSSNMGRYALIINPAQALGATDIETFWACFGVHAANIQKAHPTRYTGCNFYSILAHGTMEFRHFNDSLNPHLLLSIAKFLRAVVDLSTQASKEDIMSFDILSPTQEVSMSDAVDVIARIMNLFRKNDIQDIPSEFEMEIILDTLENSRFIALPEIPPLCHVEGFYLSESQVKLGNLYMVDKVIPPNHTDIHNIQGRIVSLFDSTPEV